MKLALLIAFSLSLAAQEPKTQVGTTVKDVNVDYYDSMADYFRNTRNALIAINRKGIPDQEIPAVLLIARRSSASPNQVIAAKQAGKSWAEITKEHKVNVPGGDFVTEANIIFLSEYHGRPSEEIRAMHQKGASFVDISQELRRGGAPLKPKTEKQSK